MVLIVGAIVVAVSTVTPIEKLLIVASFGIAIATAVAIWMGNVIEGHAARNLGEAKKQIEEATRARIALEAKMAPRRISDSQKAFLSAALLRQAGQKYDVLWFPDDKETLNLGEDIHAVLRNAGWVIDFSKEFLGFAVVEGVKIEWAPSQRERFGPVAMALASALMEIGLTAVAFENVEQERFADRIRIKVGKKPAD